MSVEELERRAHDERSSEASDASVSSLTSSTDEFAEELPVGDEATEASGSRRDFFKVMGLSATAAMTACQRAPLQNILPLTRRPDELVPGVSLWYATLCGACPARCGLLVKTRDGRPIKVEGNPAHPVSQGAVCAVGQASLLGLYDADRARGPQHEKKAATWKDADAALRAALAAAHTHGKAVRWVVPWGLGPTTEAALDALLAQHEGARVVRFDPLGVRDAQADAQEAVWGLRGLPEYRIDRADLVVSFAADFLGTWVAPAVFTRQWSSRRDPARGTMQRVVQLESILSLTGGSADERHPLPPGEVTAALAQLVAALARGADRSDPRGVLARRVVEALPPGYGAAGATQNERKLPDFSVALRKAGNKGLVLAGSEDPTAQLLAALANALLGNETTTAVIDESRAVRSGELSLAALAAELDAGHVGALVLVGVNPALARPGFAASLAKADFSLSTSERLDETAALCTVHAPEGHAWEGWSDDRPRANVEAIGQPCVAPLFDTRPRLRSLRIWAGPDGALSPPNGEDYLAIKVRWQAQHAAAGGPLPGAWEAFVRDGVKVSEAAPGDLALPPSRALGADHAIALAMARAAHVLVAKELSLVLHASVALLDGTGATSNNGWLQELPDPMTKVVWENVAAMAPALAASLGLADGDLVDLATQAGHVTLPVLRQPGLSPAVVAVALGHGRTHAGRNAAGHGANAWVLAEAHAAGVRLTALPVTVRATGGKTELALCQTHASQEGRGLVRQAELAAFREDPHAGNEASHEQGHEAAGEHAHAGGANAHGENDGNHAHAKNKGPLRHGLGLWPGHAYQGHRWGLAIDLNKCTGCAACVVSCSAENNVPVVGADEARRRREMHWLRIDRYFADDDHDNPDVLHQPMMCQHCENAPCETVCPVVATAHSSEGLNQQIYNRCVGTRYCANNCPTKVRRFNWFDYQHGDALERMVLNPDVVVRTRGVMEKCSMCVHRIEEARALSRREGRTLAEGDIETACQQSCPAQAIVFGDANQPDSQLSRLRETPRSYRILEEINVKPQVTFLTRIKNRGDHG